MKNLTSQQMQVLKIAIGQELAEILSLKLNKAGLIPTRSEPKITIDSSARITMNLNTKA